MGYRLSKIYTKTGDKGQTSLGFGKPVQKSDLIIECIGNIDELNSLLGIVLSQLKSTAKTHESLVRIQHQLFNFGAELAMPEYSKMSADDTIWLENEIDTLNEQLTPLKEFILPGGCKVAADCFYARAYARKAERNLVRLKQEENFSDHLQTYINRLSDYLFVCSRFLNKENNCDEVYWKSQRLEKSTQES